MSHPRRLIAASDRAGVYRRTRTVTTQRRLTVSVGAPPPVVTEYQIRVVPQVRRLRGVYRSGSSVQLLRRMAVRTGVADPPAPPPPTNGGLLLLGVGT